MATKIVSGPRERLLQAASELFAEEGLHTGIDRVIEKAGVAKASLYSAFGSKDELVRAYLSARHEARVARIDRAMAEHRTPRTQLLAVFDVYAEIFARPGFKGCVFIRAAAEAPGSEGVRSVCEGTRAYLRSVFADLAARGGAKQPDAVARKLMMVYDGAAVASQMDQDGSAIKVARELAADVFDAATARRS